MMMVVGFGIFRFRDDKTRCTPEASKRAGRLPLRGAPWLAWLALLTIPLGGRAQVNYVARFALERQTFLLGEPIFCKFTIENTGAQVLAFSYRTPSRALNPELEGEPRFSLSEENGQPLPDPAPKPCGGAKGSAVYGLVSLPPGQIHTERWLLNQWARFSRPGRYRVRAERRLPLRSGNAATQEFSQEPVAYALALNELSFVVTPSTQAQLRGAFQPYLRILETPSSPNASEAAQVLTTLPQPFFLEKLVTLANAPAQGRRWDRQQALEGLARLGTRAAWDEIVNIARGGLRARTTSRRAKDTGDETLRTYAVQLLGEKGDAAFLSPLLKMLSTGPETLRGDVLRVLGFFNDPRANQVLFKHLHSPGANDRVNAILGLRNLESKGAIPALIAMLNDPEAQVRQVAHFALQGLTGQDFKLSPRGSRAESARAAEQWHTWWREHGASFTPVRRAPCQDW